MSKSKRYLGRKVAGRLPAPALDLVGKAMLQGVDKAVGDRWDRALRVAAEAEGDTVEKRVRSINRRFRRELTTMGAATGAVAASPGLGTSAAAATLLADLAWFAVRAADLVMTIGAANGRTVATVDERRAWVLSVLAFGEDAADEFSALLFEVDAGAIAGGDRVAGRLAGIVGGDVASLDALRSLNARLAANVVAKYGSRRSLLAVGKVLPFGVGAVVGGSANYSLIRVVGFHAQRFFARAGVLLPPPPPTPGTGAGQSPPAVGSVSPPPPVPGSKRLPNPSVELSQAERSNSIPTSSRLH